MQGIVKKVPHGTASKSEFPPSSGLVLIWVLAISIATVPTIGVVLADLIIAAVRGG